MPIFRRSNCKLKKGSCFHFLLRYDCEMLLWSLRNDRVLYIRSDVTVVYRYCICTVSGDVTIKDYTFGITGSQDALGP